MTLKNTALFAMIGMLFLTLVLALDFFRVLTGLIDGVVPAISLIRTLVQLVAGIGLTLFLYVFLQSQAR